MTSKREVSKTNFRCCEDDHDSMETFERWSQEGDYGAATAIRALSASPNPLPIRRNVTVLGIL